MVGPSDMTTSQLMLQRPRVREACDKLRDIASSLGPAAKMPTMLELRTSVGVSNQTLHNAIRELEQQGVLHSVHGVGIFTASTVPPVEKGNLAFVLRGIQHELQGGFWGRLLAGMRMEATKSGRNLVIIDETVPFTDWQKIDGILVTNHLNLFKDSTSANNSLAELPRVSMINELPDVKGVFADDFGGLYALTQHLIGLGHRRIAYLITTNPSIKLLQERRDGYLKALKEADIEFDERWIREFKPQDVKEETEHLWVRCGEVVMGRWLNEDWNELDCTALICINDETAMGAIEALQAAGLQIPTDVSVVGFDGTFILGIPSVQLTTAQVPLYDIGVRATQMLVEWIDEGKVPQASECVPAKLIKGGSSGPCPIAAGQITTATSAELSAV